ncbi:hypothetical protein T4E_1029 [Trichinella pseudospiralis]|uniref:Uncharacterized protein n=1 Tax=Trichinella pseudospiralis TaxID=6337 RepID=A0A0V0YGQ8_TRIPS|nr:hypothetical protein T4E_1029 [Trichinella pseudospiralis]
MLNHIRSTIIFDDQTDVHLRADADVKVSNGRTFIFVLCLNVKQSLRCTWRDIQKILPFETSSNWCEIHSGFVPEKNRGTLTRLGRHNEPFYLRCIQMRWKWHTRIDGRRFAPEYNRGTLARLGRYNEPLHVFC